MSEDRDVDVVGLVIADAREPTDGRAAHVEPCRNARRRRETLTSVTAIGVGGADVNGVVGSRGGTGRGVTGWAATPPLGSSTESSGGSSERNSADPPSAPSAISPATASPRRRPSDGRSRTRGARISSAHRAAPRATTSFGWASTRTLLSSARPTSSATRAFAGRAPHQQDRRQVVRVGTCAGEHGADELDRLTHQRPDHVLVLRTDQANRARVARQHDRDVDRHGARELFLGVDAAPSKVSQRHSTRLMGPSVFERHCWHVAHDVLEHRFVEVDPAQPFHSRRLADVDRSRLPRCSSATSNVPPPRS